MGTINLKAICADTPIKYVNLTAPNITYRYPITAYHLHEKL